MKIPQHEFGFAADTFNLAVAAGADGERIARELEEQAKAKISAAACQPVLIPVDLEEPQPTKRV